MSMAQGGAKGGGRPTKEQIQEMVGKAMTDEKFRERLFTRPQEAAKDLGFAFSDRQIQVLNEVTPEILLRAGQADPQLAVAVLIPIADVAIVAAFA